MGETQQLTATLGGSASTGFTYASGTPSVATVNTSGLVTAVADGSSVITVGHPSTTSTATMTVTVTTP